LTGPQLACPGNVVGNAGPAGDAAAGLAARLAARVARADRAVGADGPDRADGAGFCAGMTCLTGADGPLAWVSVGFFCSPGRMSTGANVPPVRASAGSRAPSLVFSAGDAGVLGAEAAGGDAAGASFTEGDCALGTAAGLSGTVCDNAVLPNSNTDMTLSTLTAFVSVHRETRRSPLKIDLDMTPAPK